MRSYVRAVGVVLRAKRGFAICTPNSEAGVYRSLSRAFAYIGRWHIFGLLDVLFVFVPIKLPPLSWLSVEPDSWQTFAPAGSVRPTKNTRSSKTFQGVILVRKPRRVKLAIQQSRPRSAIPTTLQGQSFIRTPVARKAAASKGGGSGRRKLDGANGLLRGTLKTYALSRSLEDVLEYTTYVQRELVVKWGMPKKEVLLSDSVGGRMKNEAAMQPVVPCLNIRTCSALHCSSLAHT